MKKKPTTGPKAAHHYGPCSRCRFHRPLQEDELCASCRRVLTTHRPVEMKLAGESWEVQARMARVVRKWPKRLERAIRTIRHRHRARIILDARNQAIK